MFNRKKKDTVQVRINTQKKNNENSSILASGCRTVKQLLAAAGIGYPDENQLLIENNYMRPYVINYPSKVCVGTLDPLYSYKGDIDTISHIEPTEDKQAMEEINNQIVKYETQRIQEQDSGSIRGSTSIPAKLAALYEQRSRLEQNYENLFRVTSGFAIYGKDKEKLTKESQMFTANLNGDKLHVMPLTYRQDDGYRSISPFGVNKIADYYRPINTAALAAFFPFYNPTINHQNGIYIGIDKLSGTATIIDFFNRRKLGNANIFISGASGFGKTVLTSLIVLRSLPEKVRTVIIDIENEYGPCTDIANGITIKIAPDSDSMMNPFDIDVEYRLDRNGEPTGEKYVDIKGKVSELLNLFCIMVPECAESDMKSIISDITNQLYSDFGFTSNPDNLYTEVQKFNKETSEYYRGKVYKTMPRMSDFYVRLKNHAEKLNNSALNKITTSFRMFVEGGLYDMFDCYSNIDLDQFRTTPIIRFDLSSIEDEVLRPLGMYTTTQWTWNKFIKKDKSVLKRIVSDETWALLASSYMAHFLEDCGRRIRKYNGSLLCASQNFREFTGCKEGRAILANSAVKIFMRQPEEDIREVGEKFILSSGEREFVLTAGIGEALLKIGGESVTIDVVRFPFEEKLFNELDKKKGA